MSLPLGRYDIEIGGSNKESPDTYNPRGALDHPNACALARVENEAYLYRISYVAGEEYCDNLGRFMPQPKKTFPDASGVLPGQTTVAT